MKNDSIAAQSELLVSLLSYPSLWTVVSEFSGVIASVSAFVLPSISKGVTCLSTSCFKVYVSGMMFERSPDNCALFKRVVSWNNGSPGGYPF